MYWVDHLNYLQIPTLVLLMFVCSIALRLCPSRFDWPITKFFNDLARKRSFITRIAFGAAYPTLEGMILVSLVWFCWFADAAPIVRAGLITNTGAAVAAGLIAHILRYTIRATPKPIFNLTLRLHPPDVFGDVNVLRTESFPNSPGFPSQRATMFAGLAIAILHVRTDLGLLALACTVIVEFSRVFLGLHYLTDSIGSFSLGVALVLFSQGSRHLELGLWFVRWEWISASTFYMCAFIASYHVATAFQEVRELLRRFSMRRSF
jgi:membrane-associated phospholipid phosphatase